MIRVRQITDADLLYDPLTTGHKIVVPDGWQLGEDEDGKMCFVSRPSCATCKWAEARSPESIAEFGQAWTLYCTRQFRPDSGIGACDRELDGANVIVASTFGCVQWEGK